MASETVGIARLRETAVNLPGQDVVRIAGVIRDNPFPVRHALNLFGRNNLPAPLIYWHIRNRGLRAHIGGANSQYGDGAYAWPAEFPIVRSPYIDLLVLPGSLIEELRPAGKQHFYRLLPHTGSHIAIEIVGTNIDDASLEEWREFARSH